MSGYQSPKINSLTPSKVQPESSTVAVLVIALVLVAATYVWGPPVEYCDATSCPYALA